MKFCAPMSLGFIFVSAIGLATLPGFASSIDQPSHQFENNDKLALNPPALTPSGDPPGSITPLLKKRKISSPTPRTNLIGPKGVLFYCGNTDVCGDDPNFSQIQSYYQDLGASPVEQLTTLPSNLSQYRLIFVVVPRTKFSAGQVSKLNSFLVKDRRLVVMGEYEGFWGATSIGNDLLSQLEVPISFNEDTVDSGCGQVVKNFGTDPLTKNLRSAGVEYAATSTLNLGPGAIKLLGTRAKAPFMAVYRRPSPVGDVVVVGDSNSFSDGCNTANQELWKSLLLRK